MIWNHVRAFPDSNRDWEGEVIHEFSTKHRRRLFLKVGEDGQQIAGLLGIDRNSPHVDDQITRRDFRPAAGPTSQRIRGFNRLWRVNAIAFMILSGLDRRSAPGWNWILNGRASGLRLWSFHDLRRR